MRSMAGNSHAYPAPIPRNRQIPQGLSLFVLPGRAAATARVRRWSYCPRLRRHDRKRDHSHEQATERSVAWHLALTADGSLRAATMEPRSGTPATAARFRHFTTTRESPVWHSAQTASGSRRRRAIISCRSGTWPPGMRPWSCTATPTPSRAWHSARTVGGWPPGVVTAP